MSQAESETYLIKSILILKGKEEGAPTTDGGGDEAARPKKRVTFNRVVEYYTYSDNLTSWRRRLLPDTDLVSGCGSIS